MVMVARKLEIGCCLESAERQAGGFDDVTFWNHVQVVHGKITAVAQRVPENAANL